MSTQIPIDTTSSPIATQALKGTIGVCQGCDAQTFLLPLHGARGGPLRCPLCIGQWHAEHGKRRRHGRIVIRALRAYLDKGGNISDIDTLKQSAICSDFLGVDLFRPEVADPLGYLAETANTKGETIELTSELLADAIKLAHPDHHPPERQDLARRTTQRLLALQPFVFPAPKPEPEPEQPPLRRDAAVKSSSKKDPSRPAAYPCADCRDAVAADYCDACRAEYDKREQQELDRRTAKQRAQYARRRKWVLMKRPPKHCASCGKELKSKRDDARFCSVRCRQRMHRKAPVTHKSKAPSRLSFKRDILAVLDRHRAVFLNDLLPPNRTSAQYQALCRASRMLEDAGEIETLSYWTRFGKPGHVVLIKPGHKVENPDRVPRLKPEERLTADAGVRS